MRRRLSAARRSRACPWPSSFPGLCPHEQRAQYAYSSNTGSTDSAPRPVVLLEQLFGRRDAARDELLQRPEIARLVAPVVVEPRRAASARLRASRMHSRARSSILRSRIFAAKPARGTSSRSFCRSSALQSFTMSHAASSEASSYRMPTQNAGCAGRRRHGPASEPRISRKRFSRTSGKIVET